MKRQTFINTQQAVSGFNTVAVYGGLVRVHEALDVSFQNTPHRYFISVDFRFTKHVAMNIGNIGLMGCTKSEATREAKALSNSICQASIALAACKEQALNQDTFTNRYTVKMQSERYDKLVSRYCAEFSN